MSGKIFAVEKVATKPFSDQKPGTSGLRKPVTTFQIKNYTENFIQSILEGGLGKRKEIATLILGGDGRFYGEHVMQIIIQIAAANGVKRLVIAKNGFATTPAISHAICQYSADGGIILTASHNPGGPDGDFGIKYNTANGGPAVESVTQEIFRVSKELTHYYICPSLKCDLTEIKSETYVIENVGTITVEIFDSISDYTRFMYSIFDFSSIRNLIAKGLDGESQFRILIDAMHGATGPYVQRIFHQELGAPLEDLIRCNPLPDFGGTHPDPNQTYATMLIEKMKEGVHHFGAAFDGDGDRNMILGGDGFFVTPSDSLAVIANNMKLIPYFQLTGIPKLRFQPDGNFLVTLWMRAVFRCVVKKVLEQKDGIWAALAWLSVIAETKKSVANLVEDLWKEYGRHFFCRYDYDNIEQNKADMIMQTLEDILRDHSCAKENLGGDFIIESMTNFQYRDPVDHTLTTGQGYCIKFTNGARLVYRLSGTGSVGATLRMYVEKYESESTRIHMEPMEVLTPVIKVGVSLAKIEEHTGRSGPTVIT
ncbi:Phosphoglucomutase-1 [Trichinella pseudospiralis]|uniref:phosphoglucomutase (alpha-D-glucose-1,6-bisphosphate-dependent) n=1 Tax=Trichinella pseudospiralis TaxID=6337 RepID=A0A0V0Y8U6_TRIPS|nr:Phosphoglucomutase-1 [Trichinella pseudospiralis]